MSPTADASLDRPRPRCAGDGVMGDPFFITGPALISFSGGRTSAYMLWRILQAHGGALPDDVYVTFANTGKEREETLRVTIRPLLLREKAATYLQIIFEGAAQGDSPEPAATPCSCAPSCGAAWKTA